MESIEYGGYSPFRDRWELNAGGLHRIALEGQVMHPVIIGSGVPFVSGLWGRALYSSFRRNDGCERRMSKARAMVRLGNVIDFELCEGKITADVLGSSMAVRHVTVMLNMADFEVRQRLRDCGVTDEVPLESLLAGNISRESRRRILSGECGLFPELSDMEFTCTCGSPVVACRHCLAALYALGIIIDREPARLFGMWGYDVEKLRATNGYFDVEQNCPAPWRVPECAKDSDTHEEVVHRYPEVVAGNCAAHRSSEIDDVTEVWSGERIHSLRKRLGKTQKEFSDMLGVSPTAVSFWEHGRLAVTKEHRCVLTALAAENAMAKSTGVADGPTLAAGLEWNGERVKALRQKARMSLVEFASRLQVSFGTVFNWEHGRFPVSRHALQQLDELEKEIMSNMGGM